MWVEFNFVQGVGAPRAKFPTRVENHVVIAVKSFMVRPLTSRSRQTGADASLTPAAERQTRSIDRKSECVF
jgi:hypothetical protein